LSSVVQESVISQSVKPTVPMDNAEILRILEHREEVRGAKDWAAADRIRDELRSKGVEVGDPDRSNPRRPLKVPLDFAVSGFTGRFMTRTELFTTLARASEARFAPRPLVRTYAV